MQPKTCLMIHMERKGKFPSKLYVLFCLHHSLDCHWSEIAKHPCIQYPQRERGRRVIWGCNPGNRHLCLPPSMWHHYFFKPLFLESFTSSLSNLCFFISTSPSCPFSLQRDYFAFCLRSCQTEIPHHLDHSPTCPHPPLLSCHHGWAVFCPNLGRCLIIAPLMSFRYKLTLSSPLFLKTAFLQISSLLL